MTENIIDGFTGVWIPKNIWLDRQLGVMERFFYAEVTQLAGSRGCYASNAHFMKIFGIGSSRVSQLVKSLTDKNYITVKLFYRKDTKQVSRREIYPIRTYSVQKHRTELTVEELESIDEYKRDFKGVWIPRDLLFNKNINKLQMAMIIEINSLSYGDLGCFASNKHFANFLGVGSSRASQLISNLEEKEYVETKKFYDPDKPKRVLKREIYLLKKLNGVLNKLNAPTYKIKSPYLEKCKGREPSLENHIKSNTVGEPDCVIPYQSIIDYLNTKTQKTFKVTTKLTRDFISKRWNEGYRIDDFKKVIDNKVKEWINDPTRNKYLRPKTLFGDNFESYLNQKNNVSSNRKTGRQPIVEVGTDWDAPEHRAKIPTKEEYEDKQKKLNKMLQEMRSKYDNQ